MSCNNIIKRGLLVLIIGLLCCPLAQAIDINLLKKSMESTLKSLDNHNDHNFCRIIKNMNQDVVSCEIYQSYKDGHAEIATRVYLENTDNNEQPIKQPDTEKTINGYKVKIWYDKIYAGPRHKEVLMTTYQVKLKQGLRLHLTCWENHECYAEQFLEKLN